MPDPKNTPAKRKKTTTIRPAAIVSIVPSSVTWRGDTDYLLSNRVDVDGMASARTLRIGPAGSYLADENGADVLAGCESEAKAFAGAMAAAFDAAVALNDAIEAAKSPAPALPAAPSALPASGNSSVPSNPSVP